MEEYNYKVERRRMERMATFDDDEYDSDTIEEEKGEVESLIKVQEEVKGGVIEPRDISVDEGQLKIKWDENKIIT